MMRILSALALVLAMSADAAAQAPTGAGGLAGDAVIRAGDMLRVRVWPDQTLGGEFMVEASGNVYLPLIGEFAAAGLTASAAQRRIRELYGEAMKNPVISITPVFPVTVLGAVNSPGIFQADATQTVMDVLARAGGLNERARVDDIRIMRAGRTIPFNAQSALESGSAESIAVESGDRIVVPRRRVITWQALLTGLQLVGTAIVIVNQVN